MKCETISPCTSLTPEKTQTDIYFPTPLIHSLGEKTVIEDDLYSTPLSTISAL